MCVFSSVFLMKVRLVFFMLFRFSLVVEVICSGRLVRIFCIFISLLVLWLVSISFFIDGVLVGFRCCYIGCGIL